MDRLKEAIWPLHKNIEQYGPLYGIITQTIPLKGYRELLKRLYGFVFPLEMSVETLNSREDILSDFEERKRSLHLKKDLYFFNVTEKDLEALPFCTTFIPMTRIPEALGYLYLLEGSRKGGLVLAQALRSYFSFKSNKGYAYFNSNGLNVESLWHSFVILLENYVDIHNNEAEIITSAQNAFKSLYTWLSSDKVSYL
jgi:heme oxygenase